MTSLRRVAFIGNSLPRRCGIATFTTDLQQAVSISHAGLDTAIVAMTDHGQAYDYPPIVRLQIEAWRADADGRWRDDAARVQRQGAHLRPNPARVVVRQFKPATEPRDLNPTDKSRDNHIVERVLALNPEAVAAQLEEVLENFQGRHRNLVEMVERLRCEEQGNGPVPAPDRWQYAT
ncbi:MAG TPA: hypothetical protein VI653_15705 [Steroidobacteraceae bacterium]